MDGGLALPHLELMLTVQHATLFSTEVTTPFSAELTILCSTKVTTVDAIVEISIITREWRICEAMRNLLMS